MAITVYKKDNCHGKSSVLWSNETYNKTNGKITIGSDIHSIMVPGGVNHEWQIDLYRLNDYVQNAHHKPRTLKHDVAASKIDDRNDCLNVPGNLAGKVNSLRFSNQ